MPIDPGTAALAGAGISGAGSLVSSAANYMSQRENRKWSERMSNTAHQREVADLRAAGLNPVLSVMGGSGSGVPSMQPTHFDNPFADVGAGVASAGRLSSIEKPIADATLSKLGSETAYNIASKDKVTADTAVAVKTIESMDSTMALQGIQGALSAANAKMVGAKTPEQELYGKLFNVLGKTLERVVGEKDTVQDVVPDLLRRIQGSGADVGKSLWRTPMTPKYVNPKDVKGNWDDVHGWKDALDILFGNDVKNGAGQSYGGRHSAKGR